MNVRDDDCLISSKNQPDEDVIEQTDLQIGIQRQLAEPKKYKVVMLNDDYTPMDFVIMLLKRYFYKQQSQAVDMMFEIHKNGKAVCGIFTKDIAQTKIWQVMQHAKQEGHPLTCILEAI